MPELRVAPESKPIQDLSSQRSAAENAKLRLVVVQLLCVLVENFLETHYVRSLRLDQQLHPRLINRRGDSQIRDRRRECQREHSERPPAPSVERGQVARQILLVISGPVCVAVLVAVDELCLTAG